MNEKEQNPKAISPPPLPAGSHGMDVARLWLGEDKNAGQYQSVVRACSDSPLFYAEIITELTFAIAANFAERRNLAPEQVLSEMLEMIDSRLPLCLGPKMAKTLKLRKKRGKRSLRKR